MLSVCRWKNDRLCILHPWIYSRLAKATSNLVRSSANPDLNERLIQKAPEVSSNLNCAVPIEHEGWCDAATHA